MGQINKKLLPIKAHYFFMMAAMGPILPQINVFGKELGVSPDIMGFITLFLPILYVLAKPAVGYLCDFFPSIRKTIFMSITVIMILCYAGFYLVPIVPAQKIPKQSSYNFSEIDGMCDIALTIKNADLCLIEYKMMNCSMDCAKNVSQIGFVREKNANSGESILRLCMDALSDVDAFQINKTCQSVICVPIKNQSLGNCFYRTTTFWSFVILMCIGTIGFNVANSVSDAICFDMLGDKTMRYGAQRVWGTIGFGVTALIAGIVVHRFGLDSADAVKAITPALFVMVIFGVCDVISIKWLKLPNFRNEGDTIASKVGDLLRQKAILMFLCFATLAGILDSFIIYYMFWYLEELAQSTGYMESIKLIEALVVAAECLGGEIPIFLVSGKILKRIGYVHCLSLCFFMYFIRFGLISVIPNPWFLVPIEFFMQGLSYALCYTCIVGYSNEVAPQGTGTTVQGLVAGVDDGLGFSIGSLIGGQMFKRIGGKRSFQIFAIGALVTCFAHILLRPAKNCTHHLKHSQKQAQIDNSANESVTNKQQQHEGDMAESEPLQWKSDQASNRIHSNA
ncbi:major facilitator superfamily domain-containing protein 6 [Contarinia nasturtii]|uniref:major facilitator superfamily domain-containing protein 6 n=1 Tax=Contarinia nasturtii TaxID=265458 RepID=UPI0012D41811|nr:major facilitator superfamily domain-containing protein 6 [Contarinia nasturtii]